MWKWLLKKDSDNRKVRMVLSLISDFDLNFCIFSCFPFFYFVVFFPQSSSHRCSLNQCVYIWVNIRYFTWQLAGELLLANAQWVIPFSVTACQDSDISGFAKNRLFSTFKNREQSQGRFYSANQIMLLLNTLLLSPEVVQVTCPAFKPNSPVSFTWPEFTTTSLYILRLCQIWRLLGKIKIKMKE